MTELLRGPILMFLVASLGMACSLFNREGPNVSCTDLGNGATNACQDGIVVTCHKALVTYQVCDDKSACEQAWQESGAYRCGQADPVPAPASGGADDGGGASGNDAATSTPGTIAVAACGNCPSGYEKVANAINDSCGQCSSQNLCVVASPSLYPTTLEEGACPSGTHSVLTVPDATTANCSAGNTTRSLCANN
jgi:hypothetical protein